MKKSHAHNHHPRLTRDGVNRWHPLQDAAVGTPGQIDTCHWVEVDYGIPWQNAQGHSEAQHDHVDSRTYPFPSKPVQGDLTVPTWLTPNCMGLTRQW